MFVKSSGALPLVIWPFLFKLITHADFLQVRLFDVWLFVRSITHKRMIKLGIGMQMTRLLPSTQHSRTLVSAYLTVQLISRRDVHLIDYS